MTPAARVKASLDILEKISQSRIPMDGVTGDYMRFRRYIGAKDRAAIAERTYCLIRAYARLGWWLARCNREDTPRNRMILWISLGEQKNPAFFFDDSKYSDAPLTDEESKWADSLKDKPLGHPDMPPAVRVECPPQYEASLQAYFGDLFEQEMTALIDGATLDMRVNTGRAPLDKVRESLKKDGVPTGLTPYSPVGLRARGKAYLAKTKAFAKGWIDIQDEGSQLIALACDAKPGMQLLDYCAGAGGKTLALADAMALKGRIVAMDLDAKRLAKARERFRRAGVHDMIEIRPLEDHKKWLRRQKGTFDIVLADVPCTGTGTWRRNPDMRWRTYGPGLDELIAIQADILDRTVKAVKPGGRLVYATCSLLPEENEHQIEAFLTRHPDFERAPLPDAIPSDKNGYMRLTPHRHGTDGFFAAALQKKATPTEE